MFGRSATPARRCARALAACCHSLWAGGAQRLSLPRPLPPQRCEQERVPCLPHGRGAAREAGHGGAPPLITAHGAGRVPEGWGRLPHARPHAHVCTTTSVRCLFGVHAARRSAARARQPTRAAQLCAGGIPVGGITELVGPAGVGKTQLCKQLAVAAQLPVRQLGVSLRQQMSRYGILLPAQQTPTWLSV